MARTKDEVKNGKSKAKAVWVSKDPWTIVRKSTLTKLETKKNKVCANDLARLAAIICGEG